MLDSAANVVRQVYFNGTIVTCVGNGTAGFSGDSGPGTAALLRAPRAVLSDGAAGFYVAGGTCSAARASSHKRVTVSSFYHRPDTGNFCVRRWFASNKTIASVVGQCTLAGNVGDGGPAKLARLQTPRSLAFDGAGSLLIADSCVLILSSTSGYRRICVHVLPFMQIFKHSAVSVS